MRLDTLAEQYKKKYIEELDSIIQFIMKDTNAKEKEAYERERNTVELTSKIIKESQMQLGHIVDLLN